MFEFQSLIYNEKRGISKWIYVHLTVNCGTVWEAASQWPHFEQGELRQIRAVKLVQSKLTEIFLACGQKFGRIGKTPMEELTSDRGAQQIIRFCDVIPGPNAEIVVLQISQTYLIHSCVHFYLCGRSFYLSKLMMSPKIEDKII